MKARVNAALQRYATRDDDAEPPPVVANKNLLTLARGDDQLRVDWCVWKGSTFVSARLWTPAKDGSGYRPTHRGTTIRRNELPFVRDALEAAQREFEREDTEESALS